MTSLPWFTDTRVQQLGWALVQFLWQGTVLAIAFAVLRASLRKVLSPHARYALACGTLLLMMLAPLLTFAFGSAVMRNAATVWMLPVASGWNPMMPWLVALWLSGVLVFSLRLAGGWLATRRLRTVGVRPAPPEWNATFDRLLQRLGISQRVRLLVSSLVDVPVAVGWMRPVVLLPVGALTGLPAEYVTALLAHELAHIRRRDYLVNLLQRIAEAVLFYHPAVWWVSGQIRSEREMCCDDVAVRAQGDALTYARALAEVDACRRLSPGVELAANGASLLDRVRRLLGQSTSEWHLLPGPAALVGILAMWLIGVVGITAHNAGTVAPSVARTRSSHATAVGAPARSASTLLTTALLGPLGPATQAQTPRPASGAPGPPVTLTPPMPSERDRDRAFAKGTGIIRGRVFRVDTGQPLAAARVSLRGSGLSEPPVAVTDDQGRYELRALPPGRLTVVAAKDGFVKSEFGQRNPSDSGKPIELGDGQVIERIDLALPSGAVFSGQIIDEAGEPQGGVIVQAYRQQQVDGVPVPGSAVGRADATDDLGQFRIFGLPAGDYFVGAIVLEPWAPAINRFSAGLLPSSVKTLYPGTKRPREATPLHLDAGQELAGLSFAASSRKSFRITGNVRNADGSIPADVVVSLSQGTMSGGGRSFQSVTSLADGSFTTPELAPGEYSLTATQRSNRELVAAATLVLDEADVVADLTLKRGDALRGHVVFDGGSDRGSLMPSSIRIMFEGPSATVATMFAGIKVNDDWTFEATGLSGPHRFWLRLPGGWAVKSLRLSGRDVTDSPIDFAGVDVEGVELTLTQRVTTVTGLVTDAGGTKVVDATVIVLADDAEKWMPRSRFIQRGRPDDAGRFVIQGLPAGSYVAVAVKTLVADAEQNPVTLERLRRAGTRLTLKDGETRTADLRIVRAP